MGATRNGSGGAEQARGQGSLVDKYYNRSISPNAVARVRRNLFGTTSSSLQSFLDSEFSKLKTSQNTKWNFDFSNGRPLNNPNGKYIWERIADKSLNNASSMNSQKFVQKKMTDYMGKRKVSPSSADDKSKTIKTEAFSFSKKTNSSY